MGPTNSCQVLYLDGVDYTPNVTSLISGTTLVQFNSSVDIDSKDC